ncbi:perosamine synthetase [Candidatus Magnetomoraceae bacterium gMMP-1]
MNIVKLIQTISIAETSTIKDALNAIDRGAIGVSLLNDYRGQFSGLVTDGDIRRALLKGDNLNSPVNKIIRPQTLTAPINTSPEKLSFLLNGKIRCIPLLDKDKKVKDLFIHDKRSNIPVMEPQMGSKELQYVTECVLTGWISSAGKFVKEFEETFAEFCNAKYAIATSNGTTALHLALLSLNIGLGDEVIVPTLTFIATANAVTYTGAKPVFVDSELDTWNIDPKKIKEAITSKTKAIIAVHLYGHPADMDNIYEIANEFNLAVIEDAAQAHGAQYKNQKIGLIKNSTLGCFSFYGNKILTTGEGGMVITNNFDLNEKIRILRDHGMSKKQHYVHPVLGYNYRMTNLQAAIGVAQMEKVESILFQKKNIAKQYNEALSEIPGITLPPSANWADNVYWLYSILIDEKKIGIGRDDLIARFKKRNIDTRPVFTPLHQQPIYNSKQSLPVAEHISSHGLSLPSSMNLKPKDIQYVTNVLSEQAVK